MKQSQHKSLPNLMSELRDKLKQIDNTQTLNENVISELTGIVRGGRKLPGGKRPAPAASAAPSVSTTPAKTATTTPAKTATTTPAKTAAPTTPAATPAAPASSGTSAIPAITGGVAGAAGAAALWRQARRKKQAAKTPKSTPSTPSTPGKSALTRLKDTWTALPLKKSLGLLLAGSLGYLFYDDIKKVAGKAVDAFNDWASPTDPNNMVIPQPARQGERVKETGTIIDEIKSIMIDLSNYSDPRIPPAFANAVAAVQEVEKDRAAELSAIKPKQ